jgi:hypothetical protein
MNIVALAGKSGVGKDTVAERYFRPHGFRQVALADEIKFKAIALGIAKYEEVFTGEKPRAVRTWLQHEGTERGRNLLGPDVWLRFAFARMRRASEMWGINDFVITDVRFRNEVEYIKAQGGVVLLVEAPTRHKNNGMTKEQRQHESEVNLDTCDATVFHGIVLNDPQYEATVEWQVAAHLAMQGLLGYNVSNTSQLRLSDKVALLRRMCCQARNVEA